MEIDEFRLPYLGSVRITRPLPEGIPYEVTIRRRHGRWYASIACWKPPIDAAPTRNPIRGWRGRGYHSHLPWTATESSTKTPRLTATRCADWVAGSGRRPAVRRAAGAGGKLNVALTAPTAG